MGSAEAPGVDPSADASGVPEGRPEAGETSAPLDASADPDASAPVDGPPSTGPDVKTATMRTKIASAATACVRVIMVLAHATHQALGRPP